MGRMDSGSAPRGASRNDAWDKIAVVALILVAAVCLDGIVHTAMAQNPFGAPKGAVPDSQVGGIVGWLLAKQSEFYRQMSATIRAAKTDGSAVGALLGISFAYGVFHAAGPGHGKAVISSYLVANEETARRGIVLSFASALMQALMAIAIVGIGAVVLNVTAGQMCGAERVIEIASYGLIAAFGARLVWAKAADLSAHCGHVAVRRRRSFRPWCMSMVTHMITVSTIMRTHMAQLTRAMSITTTTIMDTINMPTIMQATFTMSTAVIRTARSRARLPVRAAGRAG